MKAIIFSQEAAYILLALGIGLLIGVEREYNNKAAGLRTLMLVTTGSCIFTIISMRIGINNPDRLAANIVTGIGFLGAGAIFKDENRINGITTATTIWICAALGMAVGFGLIAIALLGTSIVLIVLSLLKFVEAYIDSVSRTRSYMLTVSNDLNIEQKTKELIEIHRVKVVLSSVKKREQKILLGFKVNGSLKNHKKLVQTLLTDDKISEFEYK